ncbi:hypothetical protein VDF71_15260 [Xanthomonas campestris pv. raphani]|uniref:hypothetical protein n=1 Tax=Xanthomonas campestris TaxID=339 RepID=UPI0012902ADE|nr:hypothetical protein [Xanthomonas campestris]MEA9772615.1 hypothetical protein [Xanthomonas campestris pv. raphani]MEA9800912.1 hypothetical protein [Xanthomonas campestris pv. raphani]
MRRSGEEFERKVHFELEHGLYFLFIEWPDNPVSKWHWLDREGKIMVMDSMGLDHLKASSRLVENSLESFLLRRSGPKRSQTEVTKALEPLIREKLEELKATLRKKIDF